MPTLFLALGASLAAVAVLLFAVVLITVLQLHRVPLRRIRTRTVRRNAIPKTVLGILDHPRPALEAHGFVYRYTKALKNMAVTATGNIIFVDVYQHPETLAHATVRPAPRPDPGQPCMVQYVTCFADGESWMTVNRFRHTMLGLGPGWTVNDDYLATDSDSWRAHQARVAVSGRAVIADGLEVHERLRSMSERLVDELCAQGILKPTATAGRWRIRLPAAIKMALATLPGGWRAGRAIGRAQAAKTPEGRMPAEAGSMEAEILAFEQRQAVRNAASEGARSKLVWFIASGALFLLIGGWLFSWSFVPVLLGVVGLHELGHYFAMKLTGHKNVAVFFVPGLGGLATGEKLAAAPFEKLFVYLAGPMPGIVLAIAGLYATFGNPAVPDWVSNFIWVSLVVNYLNLLPVAPLDGGRVVEFFMFARVPPLRFLFAATCCALLLAAGLAAHDTALTVVGAIVALSLPHQWRLMLLDRQIERGQEALDESQAIRRIFAAFQHPRFKRWSFDRRANVATALLPEVVGRRPRWGETIGGLAVYAFCFFAPIAFVVGSSPQVRQIANLAYNVASMEKEDFGDEPTTTPAPEPDWNALLAQGVNAAPEERLKILLGAAHHEYSSEGSERAHGLYRDAWAIAQLRPSRDLQRLDTLLGLAKSAGDPEKGRPWLQQLIAEVPEPSGAEKLRVAAAKEYLMYAGEVSDAARVAIQQDIVALRASVLPKDDATLISARQALAHLLDSIHDTVGAEAQLRTVIEVFPLPEASERTRAAWHRRTSRAMANTELVWFFIAHDRPAEAYALAQQNADELPQKITLSMSHIRSEALAALLWSQIESQRREKLAKTWQEFEGAYNRSAFGMQTRNLVMEADRAIVAHVLDDASMLLEAKAGIADVVEQRRQRASTPGICNPPRVPNQVNWRRKQLDARVRVLHELGACRGV